MELKDIENIKGQAEEMIAKIIRTTEEKTGCVCADVDVLVNDTSNKTLIDLDLRIKHKVLDK